MTYFKNYINRFFFLHGATSDEFYTSDLQVINLEAVLHKHLQKNDYERIVYYEGQANGVRCYDEHSYALAFKSKTDKEETTVKKHTNNKVLSGVLGSRMRRKKVDETQQFTSNEHLHRKMADVDIVNQFDTLMSEKEIKTAIIFTDFNDFILHTEHEVVRNLSSKINDWNRLFSDNKNIVIFIIPSGISLQNIKQDASNYDQWQTLTSKMFTSSDDNNIKTTKQMINIISPYKDEIRNLIHHLRIRKGMEVDWLEFDESIDMLFKISKERNISLKEFSATMHSLRLFNVKELYKLFEIKEDKKGLDKLAELRGLEYLNAEINKLVKYANSKKVLRKEYVGDEVKRILPQIKKHKNEVNLHIVLSGNPGTGKTTVAKIISEVFKENDILEVGHIVEAKSSDLVGEYVGHTAVKTQEKINQAIGGVLFIDEAYKLLSNDFGQEAIDTIVEAMTARAGEFSVIIAGYPKQMDDFLSSNPGLPRRFANKISLKDYEPEILVEIFENKMIKEGYSFDDKLRDIFPHFIQNWFDARDEETFGNAGDVLNLFESMAKNANYEDRIKLQILDIPESFESGDKDNKHTYKMQDFLKKQSDDVMADALAKLDDIVGLESVKESVRKIIDNIKYEQLLDEGSKILPGHYVFKGNTGTGKTMVARVFSEILKELKVLKKGHFIEVTASQLMGDVVGAAEKITEAKVNEALGGVLFIDEAHNLGIGGENDYGKKVISTLVPLIYNNRDNLTVILAGYIKDIDNLFELDEGLSGRFPNHIIFEDYCDMELIDVFHIFNKHGKKLNISKEIENKLLKIFRYRKSVNKKFANAREVENIYNTIKSNLGSRCIRLNIHKGDKRLKIIELEDLDNL